MYYIKTRIKSRSIQQRSTILSYLQTAIAFDFDIIIFLIYENSSDSTDSKKKNTITFSLSLGI